MTLEEIVKSMWEGSPDYNKRMTLKLAAIDVRNIRADARASGEELPDDLTVRSYWETWNRLLDKYIADCEEDEA